MSYTADSCPTPSATGLINFEWSIRWAVLTSDLDDTGTTAYEALAKGLADLMDACDVVTEKFTEARDEFYGNEAGSEH